MLITNHGYSRIDTMTAQRDRWTELGHALLNATNYIGLAVLVVALVKGWL